MQQLKIELQKTLASVIKKYRKSSISKLSCEIDLSKSIWSKLEHGEKDIQLSTFWRVAEALGIKPSELLKEVENTLSENFSFLEHSA